MTGPILIAGTGSWRDDGRVDWYCPEHPFGQFLTANGLRPIYDGNQPFVWSTDLDGIPLWGHEDWSAGGAALSYFVVAKLGLNSSETKLIAHSHALQVVAFAADEHDLKIETLITVGSPIRRDMYDRYRSLRERTRFWLHIHSDSSDRWQWLGELFDGHFGIVRSTFFADRNDFVPKVSHSLLLRDPNQYHFWRDRGWLDRLAGSIDLTQLKPR